MLTATKSNLFRKENYSLTQYVHNVDTKVWKLTLYKEMYSVNIIMSPKNHNNVFRPPEESTFFPLNLSSSDNILISLETTETTETTVNIINKTISLVHLVFCNLIGSNKITMNMWGNKWGNKCVVEIRRYQLF